MFFFRIEEIRDNNNKTGLNKGGGNRNVNLQVLFHIRDARSLFHFEYLPCAIDSCATRTLLLLELSVLVVP